MYINKIKNFFSNSKFCILQFYQDMLSILQSILDSSVEMLDTWKFPKEKADPVYHGYELYELTRKITEISGLESNG